MQTDLKPHGESARLSRAGMERLVLLLEVFCLLLILLLAAYFRMGAVTHTPGWYSDEGTLMELARHMSSGEFRYLAINQSILLVARQPLFVFLLSGMMKLFGEDILTLRLLTASLGVISNGLLYILVRYVNGKNLPGLGLLAALLFAIYPSAILYSRFGFSYNLLTPLVILMAIGGWGYLKSEKRRWLALAAICVGLGIVSDLIMFTFLLPLALMISVVRWKDFVWALPCTAVPFAIYAGMMLLKVPEAFLFDLQFTFTRLGEIPLITQVPVLLANFTALLTWDLWFPLAIVGIFLIRHIRWKRFVAAMFFLPLFSIMRTTGVIGLGFYYVIPLFPFIAIGMATLIYSGGPAVFNFAHQASEDLLYRWGLTGEQGVRSWFRDRVVVLATSGALFLILIAPLLVTIFLNFQQISSGFSTAVDWVLVDPDDAREVIAFVNNHARENEVVLASPSLAWGMNAQVADFQIALAAEGKLTKHLPGNIPPDRFIFDPRLSQARYVVLDDLWRNWAAAKMEGVADMIAEVETWPLAYQAGSISVYQNPASALP